jgi:hypothetical protein
VRIALILIAALWGIAGVLALARTRDKPLDARLTAGFILAYPVLVVVLLLNAPVPLWVSVPAVFGFIPWLMAGLHLRRLLGDPGSVRADELICISKVHWLWGGLSALLLGLLFG